MLRRFPGSVQNKGGGNSMKIRIRRAAVAAALAVATVAALAGFAGANVPLTQVSADPYVNATSQHATEVEPDTFAYGSTVVATFQVGRFFNGGGSDIGVVRSGDGGLTWDAPGFLHLTFNSGSSGPYERVSDASVAYDAAHGVWLISSLPLLPDVSSPTVLINRSTDDGRTWGPPISIPPPVANNVDLDKNWTACDNHPASPFFGHCYTQFDNFGAGDRMLMSRSTDGGPTWSTPIEPLGPDKGLGGQPVVQPNGRVIVPYETLNNAIAAFYSDDGGATWSRSAKVAGVHSHNVAGGLRTSPLPTAEIAADGTVYVAWQDCRFRKRCGSNDIVFSTSSDGVSWSAPARVPIDPVTSGADYFIPGLAVDPGSSGSSTRLALTYYFYPDAGCTGGCQLEVGYTSSPNGGASWGAPTQLAGPMLLSDIAQTSQGPMVGDYISTSIAGGSATTVFPVGLPHSGSTFDEAMYAPTTPLPIATADLATRAVSSRGVVVSGTGARNGAIHRR
jgi:hypothetical protein